MTDARTIMLAALHSRDGHALKHTHGEIVDAIIAALSAGGKVIEDDWQPIETAPKDGTVLLAYSVEGNCFDLVRWDEHEDADEGLLKTWMCDVSGGSMVSAFTHWRPLRKPAATPPGEA